MQEQASNGKQEEQKMGWAPVAKAAMDHDNNNHNYNNMVEKCKQTLSRLALSQRKKKGEFTGRLEKFEFDCLIPCWHFFALSFPPTALHSSSRPPPTCRSSAPPHV